MKAITIFDAGQVLASEMGWNIETEENEVVPFDMFWKACIMRKLTCSDRKIKEFWNAFQKLGVAKKVNNKAVIFYMSSFKTMMAVEFAQWRQK